MRPVYTACEIEGCDKLNHGRRYCSMHRTRLATGVPLDTPFRKHRDDFDLLYRKDESGCWEWLRTLTSEGYGKWRRQFAHRVSYERHVGPIPEGLQIDHLCRNRACVNPDHLEAVDQRTNILRSNAPNAIAWRTGRCKYGHDFTLENTYVRKDNGARQCRACRRRRDAEAKAS